MACGGWSNNDRAAMSSRALRGTGVGGWRHGVRLSRRASAQVPRYARIDIWETGMIPLKYNIQNLRARGVSTFMSILGIGIVIAVMLSMMALYNGVKKATTTKASKDSMMV